MGQESETTANSSDAEPSVDVSAAIAAQVFGNVPLVGPDWLRSSIAMQANFAQLLPGATSTTAADLNGPRNRAEREEDEAKAKSDRMMNAVEEAERQREEWARTSHSFGTTTMTGEQWGTLSEELEEGGAVRNWLLARIMRDGHTQEEAERLADRVRNVARIMAIPESQRTPEQRRELREANRDPEVQEYVEAAADYAQTVHGAGISREQTAVSGQTAQSVVAGADALEIFASAPDLSGEFRTAQAAVTPLDVPGTGRSTSNAPPPQPVLASGFAV